MQGGVVHVYDVDESWFVDDEEDIDLLSKGFPGAYNVCAFVTHSSCRRLQTVHSTQSCCQLKLLDAAGEAKDCNTNLNDVKFSHGVDKATGLTGRYLAVGASDNTVYVYEDTRFIEGGKPKGAKGYRVVGQCKGHSSYITHIDWSDGIEHGMSWEHGTGEPPSTFIVAPPAIVRPWLPPVPEVSSGCRLARVGVDEQQRGLRDAVLGPADMQAHHPKPTGPRLPEPDVRPSSF